MVRLAVPKQSGVLKRGATDGRPISHPISHPASLATFQCSRPHEPGPRFMALSKVKAGAVVRGKAGGNTAPASVAGKEAPLESEALLL